MVLIETFGTGYGTYSEIFDTGYTYWINLFVLIETFGTGYDTYSEIFETGYTYWINLFVLIEFIIGKNLKVNP